MLHLVAPTPVASRPSLESKARPAPVGRARVSTPNSQRDKGQLHQERRVIVPEADFSLALSLPPRGSLPSAIRHKQTTLEPWLRQTTSATSFVQLRWSSSHACPSTPAPRSQAQKW